MQVQVLVLPPQESLWFAIPLTVWLLIIYFSTMKLIKTRPSRKGVLAFLLGGTLLFALREATLWYLDYRVRTHTVTSFWLYRLAYISYPESHILIDTGISEDALWLNVLLAAGSFCWALPLLLIGSRAKTQTGVVSEERP
ncbi:MAG TPA: hypothetical protein VF131_14135 [Blastocatellia bacterium]|nr:hypothetical protein [Blastocatellia bacterium]